MSVNYAFAKALADAWISAWNERDLPAVLAMYADDVEFASPLVVTFAGAPSGTLRGKAALRDYWARALAAIPELRLELEDLLVGVECLTIVYQGHRGRAADTMWLGDSGLVVRAEASYAAMQYSATKPRHIIDMCVAEFDKTRRMCEAAIAQLSDAQLHVRINPHQNSIAVIVQHMAGNMISRFTDFLTSDGEKPTRDREGEFADRQLSRTELLALWQSGWEAVLAALRGLSDADLSRTVTIRGEAHTVFQAINRQTAHYALHMGQILLIGKHLLGERWRYLTIAPGASDAFNRSMGAK